MESKQPAADLHYGPDQIPDMEPATDPILRRKSFLFEFARSDGPPQIVVLIMLLALGFGSTVGVVPAVMTDRYARVNHGYSEEMDCQAYSREDKPSECLWGSADAQNAVALEQLVSNGLTFFTSSLIGSFSDEYGRKGILTLGVALSVLSPLTLLLIQLRPSMSPFWYYTAGAIQGLVNWIAVALSALSDVMPPHWRAPSFGLLLAGFSLGFALAPGLALQLGHVKVTILSLCLVLLGLGLVVRTFPETLPPETALQARQARHEQTQRWSPTQRFWRPLYRPLWELSILNRNEIFRLLSCLAFFSGMVTSGDRTLLIYYLEERLEFNDQDVAVMFMIMGLLGIFVQGFVLKVVNDALGERWLVTLCFSLGVVYNFLYGLADRKTTIFVAVAISTLGGMAFPTISAIKSNNVNEAEQGRIQGALYSLQAVASAAGPMALRTIYHFTKDGAFLGPGSMFIFAGCLYMIAVYCAYLLPVRGARRKVERWSAALVHSLTLTPARSQFETAQVD